MCAPVGTNADGTSTDHRFTGDLSMYIPFIDIAMGRGYVEHSEMRLSFPYFVGPTTWCFFHTVGEAVGARKAEEKELIVLFKGMLSNFPRIYPCPFCRQHMTT